MIFSPSASRTEAEAALERSFGAADLLQLVLEGVRPALGFDLAAAVLCDDNTHAVPIYSAGKLSSGVIEGVHVQALQAFVELAGKDHASWPSLDPVVITLGGGNGRDGDDRINPTHDALPVVIPSRHLFHDCPMRSSAITHNLQAGSKL